MRGVNIFEITNSLQTGFLKWFCNYKNFISSMGIYTVILRDAKLREFKFCNGRQFAESAMANNCTSYRLSTGQGEVKNIGSVRKQSWLLNFYLGFNHCGSSLMCTLFLISSSIFRCHPMSCLAIFANNPRLISHLPLTTCLNWYLEQGLSFQSTVKW